MDFRGIAVLIIAGALSLAWVLAISGTIITGRPITEKGLEVLGVLGGALIGVIAAYIATKDK